MVDRAPAFSDLTSYSSAPPPPNSTWLTRLAAARTLALRHASSISQTFFVWNPWVGLASIGVLLLASPRLALAALVASALARFVAERLAATRTLLEGGLVELNGWFFGLACATFFTGPILLAVLPVGAALCAVFCIVLQRVLATWDLPLVVGAYMPAFWLLWSALAAFPWAHGAAPLVLAPATASPALLAVIAGLRGLGQIFFLPNAYVGVGVVLCASIGDYRLGPAMFLASVASVGIGIAAHAPAWQIHEGLAGFTAALIAAGTLRKFSGLGWVAVLVSVASSPFLEAAAIRSASALGLHALSASYVGLIWILVLLRPVREANSARRGWSMSPRPRSFDEA